MHVWNKYTLKFYFINKFSLSHFSPFLSQAEILGALKKVLVDVRPSTFDDCIVWARKIFEEYFHDTIAQLLFNFPPEHVRKISS